MGVGGKERVAKQNSTIDDACGVNNKTDDYNAVVHRKNPGELFVMWMGLK